VSLVPPGSTIGILGGGQLGRMLAIAAAELGYRTHIYCPEATAPASEVAALNTVATYDNAKAMAEFAKKVSVVTYEFENIPAAPVEALAKLVPVFPSPAVLSISQHRLKEKTAIKHLGIGTAPFAAVNSLAALKEAANSIGLPAVLKTCRMGYDGKGQVMVKMQDELEAAWSTLKTDDAILEGFVNFTMEISVIVARNEAGEVACYPAVENIHKHHILAETIAPARISEALATKAEQVARTIAEGLKLVGLMAVEMFVTDDGDILVNETAPRPHNSGHWTIDACITSQFAQTVRAVCGLPLGSTRALCNARMLNLIGDEVNEWPRYAAMENAKLHLYGKAEARPGRKMGHVTLLLAK